MIQIILRIVLSIIVQGTDITVLITIFRSRNFQLPAILQGNGCFLKIRSSHHIFIATRTYRIKAQRCKHIPGGSLSVILVATISIRGGKVQPGHYLTQPVLCFPRFAGIIIQVNHVLDRLITMCIIAHVSYFHLANLMDHSTVITIIKYRRKIEYRIEHAHKHFLTAHQIDKSLRIVEDRPSIMPAVSFGKGVSPLKRIERCLESSVGIFATHQFRFQVKQVPVVLASLLIEFQFFCRASQLLAHAVDTPVIVCILQCTCGTLIDFHIIRHISQFIVILISATSGSRNPWMHAIGTGQ